MKYWQNGIFWSGIDLLANQPGTTKYWHGGAMFGNVFPGTGTPADPFIARAFWFN